MIPAEWAELLHSDDSVEGIVPIQHLAPVPNNVCWTELALYIALAAAIFTLGFMRIIRHHIDENHIHPLWDIPARVVLCALCAYGGVLVGERVWDATLGGALAAVGSGGHVVILHAVYRIASILTGFRYKKTEKV